MSKKALKNSGDFFLFEDLPFLNVLLSANKGKNDCVNPETQKKLTKPAIKSNFS